MRHSTPFILFGLIAAMFLPVDADAQLRGLRQRIQDRAEDRVEQRVQSEIDREINRAVDAAVDQAIDGVTGMLSDAFTNNKTTVDEEAGVIRTEEEGDIALRANQTSPARSDYLSYIEVTKYEIRGTVGAMLGNGQYQRFYLHDDKMLQRNLSSGTMIDAASGSMTAIDYEEGTYWTHSFSDFGAMLDSAQRVRTEAMQSIPAQPVDRESEVGLDVNMEVRQGGRAVIRGSNSQQHFLIVETGSPGGQTQQEGGLSGKMFMVSEVWTTDDIAGHDTYREFSERMVAAMGSAMSGSATGQSPTSGMLADARVEAAMERAAEEMSSMQGLVVETRNYLVSVPAEQEFDLDLVLADEEFDMNTWAVSMSSEPVEGYEKKQVTIMSWKTFISNLSADPFDLELLELGDLQQVQSPLEQFGSMPGR